MKDCSPGIAPIVKGDKFSLNQCPQNDLEREQMRNIPYASAIRSLMYAQVCTRRNIGFAFRMFGRYQSNPSLEHWKTAKKVMRYLRGTKEYRLTYKHSDFLEAIGYSELDFVGCVDIRMSTSGYIYLFAGRAVAWRSAKQTSVASSTMEAEYIAVFEASAHANWLRNFIKYLKIVASIARPLKIYSDNMAIVYFAKNNKNGSHKKHIDIKYLVVRRHVRNGEISIEHISTQQMIAYPITKGLLANLYKSHVENH
ncbi:secreted RxLR effector protein 161-like [Pyrus x bretschneideri]|uniref:secreted RxLR effector protein 161-like n=1 Tax=Pyrus x bretschneideri TaxID=225117 RepID=UPI00202E0292|nr:secreted RxLR effector protein 161-like [Pyrus x bretschneideri]